MSWSSVLEALEADGFDGEAENVRCLVQMPPRSAGPWGGWLDGLRRGASAGTASPRELAAVEGRLLLRLGSLEPARVRLAAAAAEPGALPARAWLGECLLLMGDFRGAKEQLDEAVASGPPYDWARFFRAAAALALGDAVAARADNRLFAGRRPGAAAFALDAMIAASEGLWPEAARQLERAASATPEDWPLVLRALLATASGDHDGARAAYAAALAKAPSAWLHAQRARAYERLGMLPEAIADAARAASLEPTAEHLGLKASLHSCWREHEAADAEYGRALAVAPGDAGLRFERSKARLALGRLGDAVSDAAAAARLAPGSADLLAWEAELLALAGRYREARARASALPSAGLARFCAAYLELVRGRSSAAARGFAAAEAAAPPGGALRQKAAFYRVAALAAGSAPRRPAPRRAALLHLIGMGVNPPYSATAEALRALRDCDVVFNNIMGGEMLEFLAPFCRDLRPLAYHQDNDEGPLAGRVMAEMRRGRTVGFVTRGNALVYGPLGALLRRLCLEGGHDARCLPAVSSAELLTAKFGGAAGGLDGHAAMDSAGLNPGGGIDPGVPLTLYVDIGRGRAAYEDACGRLAESYGPDRACLVLDHVIGQVPLSLPARELGGLWGRLSPSAIVFLPAPRDPR